MPIDSMQHGKQLESHLGRLDERKYLDEVIKKIGNTIADIEKYPEVLARVLLEKRQELLNDKEWCYEVVRDSQLKGWDPENPDTNRFPIPSELMGLVAAELDVEGNNVPYEWLEYYTAVKPTNANIPKMGADTWKLQESHLDQIHVDAFFDIVLSDDGEKTTFITVPFNITDNNDHKEYPGIPLIFVSEGMEDALTNVKLKKMLKKDFRDKYLKNDSKRLAAIAKRKFDRGEILTRTSRTVSVEKNVA